MMDLKSEILQALRSGAAHAQLCEFLAVAHREGIGQREAYLLLEDVWRELGFDEICDDMPAKDELEYLMEGVWGWPGFNPWGGYLTSSADGPGYIIEHRWEPKNQNSD